MRKISIESSNFMALGNEPGAFEKMREAGYDACDYSTLADIGKSPIYALSEHDFVRTLTETRKNAESAGVEIYQAHGPWVWPTGNDTPEGRARWMAFMKKDADACEILGCPHLVVHPIMPFWHTSAPDEEGYLAINRAFWEELLPYAEKRGVTVCLENMPFTEQSLSRCIPMRDFVLSFGAKNFKMCLDTGHALVCGDKLGESVKEIGGLLRCLHVHDHDGKQDRHECPFFGVGDWDEFREALRAVDESVPLSLEIAPKRVPAELRDGFLREYAKIARYLAE